MSIPIDKLYHYIEGIARSIRGGDDIVIYRFYPHGSKKLTDLTPLSPVSLIHIRTSIGLYCNDQEPLTYDVYENQENLLVVSNFNKLLRTYNLTQFQSLNLKQYNGIYDKALLLHSELNSTDVLKYSNNGYIPVYYWSHAIIAHDWYRYAQYEQPSKTIKKIFLIYNRAWSGSREYRLKFIDLLIDYNLVNACNVSFNPVEPELQIHYTQHSYINKSWLPNHNLEYYIPSKTGIASSASADYEIADYNATEFEVVLETLFDDDRIQLTEKILRPIALGQPFLLAAGPGSLEYLRSYGFRTFASVIDESYDTIEDPLMRLDAIVKSMRKITEWSNQERAEKMALANQIAAYNRKHFFSDKFFNTVIDELHTNLKNGITELENTNTSEGFFKRRKELMKYPEIANEISASYTRKNTATMLKKARRYYRRTLPKE